MLVGEHEVHRFLGDRADSVAAAGPKHEMHGRRERRLLDQHQPFVQCAPPLVAHAIIEARGRLRVDGCRARLRHSHRRSGRRGATGEERDDQNAHRVESGADTAPRVGSSPTSNLLGS